MDKKRCDALLGKNFMDYLNRLQGALQLPWETVFLQLLSMTSFSLHQTVAQYTKMLGIPALPWLGLVGRPGEAKSVVIWFIKQVVMELQKRGRPEGGCV